MGTMISSGTDVVSFLKEQHVQVKGLFERVLSLRGDARTKAFIELRRTMAVHETAEEEIVHPVARRNLPNGQKIVEARLQEENEAKRVLSELERYGIDSPEFETKLRKLQAAVLAHAESEERTEFDRLANMLDQSKLERMRKAVKFAESVAPTHMHPSIGESQAANVLVGPFASMLDRARDAISGKS
ncbi:MAG: hemerythrin domain-containing protein [Polyangiaceae bacterium]